MVFDVRGRWQTTERAWWRYENEGGRTSRAVGQAREAFQALSGEMSVLRWAADTHFHNRKTLRAGGANDAKVNLILADIQDLALRLREAGWFVGPPTTDADERLVMMPRGGSSGGGGGDGEARGGSVDGGGSSARRVAGPRGRIHRRRSADWHK